LSQDAPDACRPDLPARFSKLFSFVSPSIKSLAPLPGEQINPWFGRDLPNNFIELFRFARVLASPAFETKPYAHFQQRKVPNLTEQNMLGVVHEAEWGEAPVFHPGKNAFVLDSPLLEKLESIGNETMRRPQIEVAAFRIGQIGDGKRPDLLVMVG